MQFTNLINSFYPRKIKRGSAHKSHPDKNIDIERNGLRKSDFEQIKQQISIEVVADYLMEKQGNMYIFPGEHTGSVKVYVSTQTFYDFGRGVGGDCVRLWSHVRGVDNWQALQEIKAAFGIDAPDKVYSREVIEQQEQAYKQQLEDKKQKQRQWVQEVDQLKAEVSLLSGVLESGHLEPLSWAWCLCQNWLTSASGKLDLLCGIE